jgi:hypothetical protein
MARALKSDAARKKALWSRAFGLIEAAYAAGATDASMAVECGTTANTIYRYRTGKLPITPFMATKIISALSGAKGDKS